MRDVYGSEILVGSEVAYNYAGEVRFGRVAGFKNRTLYRKPRVHILVNMYLGDGRYTEYTSEVTNNLNMVVIK